MWPFLMPKEGSPLSKEIHARVERSAYLPHTDQTEIVVRVKGELRPERGDVVVVTVKEGKA